jgi:predicted dehydrogenase
VATPPYLRGEIVRAAFAAGKSVFCEKPLATTLEEADSLIQAAERAKVRLGVNYVMRHHAAYAMVERLAGSGLLGKLKTVSFTNFAQAVPRDHWFWDREKSGGILVEHGVHFFDAYARLAGEAEDVTGCEPRPAAAEASVRYLSGAVGRYYHEFSFPSQVEYTSGVSGFDRGYVLIDGWIPTLVHGRIVASVADVHDVVGSVDVTLQSSKDGSVAFSAQFGDRQQAYARAVVDGIRDVLRCHRDATAPLLVPPADARASLLVALQARDDAGRGMRGEST